MDTFDDEIRTLAQGVTVWIDHNGHVMSANISGAIDNCESTTMTNMISVLASVCNVVNDVKWSVPYHSRYITESIDLVGGVSDCPQS